MRKVVVLTAIVALFGAPSLFGADLSVGGDVPIGLTYWKHADATESTNGLLLGVNLIGAAMFTPQLAGEIKIGIALDMYSEEVGPPFDETYDSTVRYLNVVGLFKYYVNPSVFIGAGLELNYFLSEKWDFGILGSDTDKRGDLNDTEDLDPLFVLAAAGYEFVAAPAIVVPIGVNVAYGIVNIPDDVTRMHIYATVGVRYLL